MTDLGPMFRRPLTDEHWYALRDLMEMHAYGYVQIVQNELLSFADRATALSWLMVYKFIDGEDAVVSVEFLHDWHVRLTTQ